MQYKYSLVVWLIVAVAVSVGFGLAGKQQAPSESPIYFLSGSETPDTDETFPVNLYRVSPNGRLNFVREIVSQRDGLHSVRAFGDVAFVAYPHLLPTTISVVHFDEAMRKDEVPFNPESFVVIDSKLAMAEPVGSRVRELLFLADPGGDRKKDFLASVASAHVTGEPRVALNQWTHYAALRFDGHSGGPTTKPDLVASLSGADIVIQLFSRSVRIETLPGFLTQGGGHKHKVPVIIAANKQYFVFMFQHTSEQVSSGGLVAQKFDVAYVHDRNKGKWREFQIEGTCSRSRLFGPWLATIVQQWDPGHKPNSGVDNERSEGTEGRPNVRSAFQNEVAKNCSIPGILVIRNLADRRVVRIETHQEDSEVLSVKRETVFYRVNDTIYRARMAGDRIENKSLLVKGDDVPEIHWMYWAD